jgi:hypothetical protein
MLNQKYNKINGINFVWSNGVKASQNKNAKIESVLSDFVFGGTSGDRLYNILNKLTGAGWKYGTPQTTLSYGSWDKAITPLKTQTGVGYVINVKYYPEKLDGWGCTQLGVRLFIIIYQPKNSNKTYINFVYGIDPQKTKKFAKATSEVPANLLQPTQLFQQAVSSLTDNGLDIPYQIVIDKPLDEISSEDLTSDKMKNSLGKIMDEVTPFLRSIEIPIVYRDI